MVTTRYIFPKPVHFFPIFEKGQGKPFSPSSSYAPDLTCHYSYSHICFPIIKTLRRNPLLESTFKMMNILSVTFHLRAHFFQVNLSVSANVF